MKLGVLFVTGGSIALVGAIMGILSPFIFPEAEPSIVVVVGRVLFALFLGLYMLPRGLLKIKEARHNKEVRYESQVS